jgi:WhiB family redox-sensing transcriptional regulator
MSKGNKVRIEIERPDWMAHGACKDRTDVSFFPGRGEDSDPAKKVCYGCPVRLQCLTYAMQQGEKYGIWGGLSERDRKRIRSQHRRARNVA